MEKEALIDIILNDLKEIHALVKTFKGKTDINTAFINLTRTKITNITEELSLLEELNGQKTPETKSESALTSEIPSPPSSKDNDAIAESSNQFFKGEAVVHDPPQEEKPIAKPDKISTAKSDKAEISVERKSSVQAPSVDRTKKTAKSANPVKPTVLGESIKQDATSLNENMASNKNKHTDIKQIGKPVDDVRKAIGLNDRFYFQRELFDNNANVFNQTLDQVNAMDSFDSAVAFLTSNFKWDAEEEVTTSFFKSIQRRFL